MDSNDDMIDGTKAKEWLSLSFRIEGCRARCIMNGWRIEVIRTKCKIIEGVVI